MTALIRVESLALYRHQPSLGRMTKRLWWEIASAPDKGYIILFEGWGFERGKGFAWLCRSEHELQGALIERVKKQNLMTFACDEYEIRYLHSVTLTEEQFVERMKENTAERGGQEVNSRVTQFLMRKIAPRDEITEDLAYIYMGLYFRRFNEDDIEAAPAAPVKQQEEVIVRDQSWGSWA